jgi:drug/metabolite transporter (DMT)-like permease
MKSGKLSERTGALFVILSAVLFGTMPLLTKTAYAFGGNNYTVSFGRFVFGSATTAVIVALSPKMTFRITARDFRWLLATSVFCGVTPLLLFESYHYIDSGLSTTLHFTYPVTVMVLGALFFRTKLRRRQILCLLICAAGVICFYRPGQMGDVRGMALAVLSGVTFALYILLLGRSGLKRLPLLTLSFWTSLLCAVEIGLFAGATGRLHLSMGWQAWAAVAALGVFVAALAQVLFQAGVFLCGGVKASLLSTFEPLTGVMIGVLVFREAMMLRAAAGVALILLAAALLVLGPGGREDG